jgi:hypothetical protein
MGVRRLLLLVLGSMTIGTCTGCVVPNENFDGAGGGDCMIEDEYAPNETLEQAYNLGEMPQYADARTVETGLGEAGEANWFTVLGLLGRDSSFRPSIESQAEVDLRLCVFGQCPSGATIQVAACAEPRNEGDLAGCCGTSRVIASLACPTLEDIRFYMRVDGGPACTPYRLDYRL